MTNTAYTLRTDRTDAYLRQDIRKASRRMEREFAYFSANLYNFLPHIPRREYLSIFNQLQANRMLADLDIEQAANLQARGWDEEGVERLRDRPGIICTYHTGSYRYLGLLLAQAGIPTSIVVAGNVLPAELVAYRDRYAPSALRMGIHADITFIDAGQPHSLIAMARAAKSGRNLLVYLDGNTGAAMAREHAKQLLEVPFCGQTIRVRKGTATLAHRLALPIHPVACLRSLPWLDPAASHELYYWQADALSARQDECEDGFSERAIGALYGVLAQFASRSPHEWEGWLHIHHDLASMPQPAPDDVFRAAEWATYRSGNRAYFLHLKTYRSVCVSWADYRYLNGLHDQFH